LRWVAAQFFRQDHRISWIDRIHNHEGLILSIHEILAILSKNPMGQPLISVAEAHEIIARCVRVLSSERTRLGDLLGLRLAEDVTSGVDSPPFDKSQVDGYAIATSDSSPVLRELELVTAGQAPRHAVGPGTTIRVMTGAPIPEGADAVVKWEDCDVREDGAIANPAGQVKPGSSILKRGSAFRVGQVVLNAGKLAGPLDIALLAEIGRAEVAAFPRPRVGVLATGDELVAAHEPVGPGQIRNSNGPMLLAALEQAGARPVDLGVGRDDPSDLREKIGLGLECDVLLVSGGVSAGVKDLAPSVLAELGVEEQFHQVRVKPGKPLWFGVRDQGRRRTLVFGLPGNPVSTLVSFRLFVVPALQVLAGAAFSPPLAERGLLTKRFEHRGGRPTYFPCLREGNQVEPLAWKGSADQATLTRANCLAAMPPGDYTLEADAEVEIISL
jgi:molybdopterin molybdotransferase